LRAPRIGQFFVIIYSYKTDLLVRILGLILALMI